MLELAIWWAASASLLLPVLSYSGYPVTSAEYLVGGCIAFVAAVICRLIGKVSWLRHILLLTLAALVISTYYAGLIKTSLWGAVVLGLFSIGFIAITLIDYSKALRVAGVVSVIQIATAAVSTPDLIRDSAEKPVTRKNMPSVIHLVLDEHVGMAAIPDAFTESRRRLEEAYVARGFVVFRRAYSLEKFTQRSIARLVNPGIDDPESVLHLLRNPRRWVITRSDAFVQIGAERALDLTYFDYVAYDQPVISQPAVTRWTSIDSDVAVPPLTRFSPSAADRAAIAASKSLAWFRSSARAPAVKWLLRRTEVGRFLWKRSDPIRRTHPIAARAALLDLIDRLSCCGERGTYYFAHLYLPHYPYVFDAACQVRPALEWRTLISDRIDEPDTLETRHLRYMLHLDQAACAAQDVGRLVAASGAIPELRDATIIVHSDHGSRIAIENRAGLSDQGYDDKAYERDLRGAFFAVKIPGLAGGLVDKPVRIDVLYNALLSKNFRSLDLKTLPDTSEELY